MENILQYGLIGNPLGHSFSEAYFTEKFAKEGIRNVAYKKFPLKNIEEFPAFLSSYPDICGFNVTIPYKEQIIPYLDSIDPAAEAIGAVNCVCVGQGGSLMGYNTDAPAFRDELLKFIGDYRPAALVLGSGGASKAVCFVLRGLDIEYVVVSRSPVRGQIIYSDVTHEMIHTHKLIINTTPLGMFPDTESYPSLPYDKLTTGHYLFDLVYNPPLTEFMRRSAAQGAKTMNGYGMLTGQAELSWAIWMRVAHTGGNCSPLKGK